MIMTYFLSSWSEVTNYPELPRDCPDLFILRVVCLFVFKRASKQGGGGAERES